MLQHPAWKNRLAHSNTHGQIRTATEWIHQNQQLLQSPPPVPGVLVPQQQYEQVGGCGRRLVKALNRVGGGDKESVPEKAGEVAFMKG